MAGFIKQLVSKVAIMTAAGAAEQTAKHAASEWWQKRKQKKADQEEGFGEVEVAPASLLPVAEGKHFPNLKELVMSKVNKFKQDRAGREWLKRQTAEQQAPSPEKGSDETETE
jgi:hypothetical protein